MLVLRERGLRPDVCRCAEPQMSECINSIEWKTNTMKTYILKPFPAVETQKPSPLGQQALSQTTTASILGRPAPADRLRPYKTLLHLKQSFVCVE